MKTIVLWPLWNLQNQHIADRERSATVVVLISGAFVWRRLIYERCLHLSEKNCISQCPQVKKRLSLLPMGFTSLISLCLANLTSLSRVITSLLKPVDSMYRDVGNLYFIRPRSVYNPRIIEDLRFDVWLRFNSWDLVRLKENKRNKALIHIAKTK